MKKITEWTKQFPETVTVTWREGVLVALVCLLAGIVAGMLCSPRRCTMIASHNGNTCRKREEDAADCEQES